MSVELHVYTAKGRLPSVREWIALITSSGVSWRFDLADDASLSSMSGAIEVEVNGERSSFELFVVDLPAESFVYSRKNDDTVVVFTSGSDGFECSLLAAGALARASKGKLFDPQEEKSMASSRAAKLALEMLGVGGKAEDAPGCIWDGRKVSPLEWIARVGAIISDIDPAYRRTSSKHGIEYARRDANGVWKIHTFLRRRTLGIDHYYGTFNLSLTSTSGPSIRSPLWLRSRFDADEAVHRMMSRELGATWKCNRHGFAIESASSLHPSQFRLRLQSFDDVRHNCHVAEEYLYPHLLGVYRKVARPLAKFIEFVTELVQSEEFAIGPTAMESEIPQLDEETMQYFVYLHRFSENPNPAPFEFEPHYKLRAALIARVAKLTRMTPVAIAKVADTGYEIDSERLITSMHRGEVAEELWFAGRFVSDFETLWTCREELGEMRETLLRLASDA